MVPGPRVWLDSLPGCLFSLNLSIAMKIVTPQNCTSSELRVTETNFAHAVSVSGFISSSKSLLKATCPLFPHPGLLVTNNQVATRDVFIATNGAHSRQMGKGVKEEGKKQPFQNRQQSNTISKYQATFPDISQENIKSSLAKKVTRKPPLAETSPGNTPLGTPLPRRTRSPGAAGNAPP